MASTDPESQWSQLFARPQRSQSRLGRGSDEEATSSVHREYACGPSSVYPNDTHAQASRGCCETYRGMSTETGIRSTKLLPLKRRSDNETKEPLTYQYSSLCSQRISKAKEALAKSTSHTESATKT